MHTKRWLAFFVVVLMVVVSASGGSSGAGDGEDPKDPPAQEAEQPEAQADAKEPPEEAEPRDEDDPATPAPDAPDTDDEPASDPPAEDAVTQEEIDEMVEWVRQMPRVIPSDGGTLNENGSFASTYEGKTPFDVDVRWFVDETGRLVFYLEGPPILLQDLSIEFDAVDAGFNVVAETSVLGLGDGPPWVELTVKGSAVSVADNPPLFAKLPDRVGAVIITNITTLLEFVEVSMWLYSGFKVNAYDYAHYLVLYDELTALTDTGIDAIPEEVNTPLFQDGQATLSWTEAAPRFTADLSLAKTLDNPTPAIGDTIEYTIEVTNNGPNLAARVQVTDHLPECLESATWTTSRGTYDGWLWDVGELADGITATLQITATVTAACSGQVDNLAEITRSSLPDPGELVNFFDPQTLENNNRSSAGFTAG